MYPDVIAGSPSLAVSPEAGSEESLVAALRAREDRAFESVVRSYGPRLLIAARRLLRSDEDAQDALQDAFLSAFRSIDRFEGHARLSTWLHRIVVNASLMKLRTRRRHAEATVDELPPCFRDEAQQPVAAVPCKAPWDDPLEREQDRALVRRCIEQLPEAYRSVLLLRDIEELDTHETAQRLGVTENAVKIRLHRARQSLRALLDPYLRGVAAPAA